MNRPTPSRERYKNTPIVIALIIVYQPPSTTIPNVETSLTCARSNIYGIKKYRGSSKGVGSSVGTMNTGKSKV